MASGRYRIKRITVIVNGVKCWPHCALGIAGSSSMQLGCARTWLAEAPKAVAEGTPYNLVRAGPANALLPKSPPR